MAEQPEATVDFRITRPKTLIFHPTKPRTFPVRGPFPASQPLPGQPVEWTEPEILEGIPKSIADKWVAEGVGEIVEAEKPAATAGRGPGRPRSSE